MDPIPDYIPISQHCQGFPLSSTPKFHQSSWELMLSDPAEPGARRAPASCCPWSGLRTTCTVAKELPVPSQGGIIQGVCSGASPPTGQHHITSATAQGTGAETTIRSTRGTNPRTTESQGSTLVPALERQKACPACIVGTAHGASPVRNGQLAQICHHLP